MPVPAPPPSMAEVRAAVGPVLVTTPPGRSTPNPGARPWGPFAEGVRPTGTIVSDGPLVREGRPGDSKEVPYDADDADCPVVREILSRVGDKWSARILALLSERPMRFSELRRTVPQISQRMLSHTLRCLERDGVLVRAVYPTVPPKVEYGLSPSGRSLLTILDALASWARANQGEIIQARNAFRRRSEADSSPTDPHRPDLGTGAGAAPGERHSSRNVARHAAGPMR